MSDNGYSHPVFAPYMASVASSGARVTAHHASLAAALAAVMGATGQLDAQAVAHTRRSASRCLTLSREAAAAYRRAGRAASRTKTEQATGISTTRAYEARERAGAVYQKVAWLLAGTSAIRPAQGTSIWAIPIGQRARLRDRTLQETDHRAIESAVLWWASSARPRDQLLAAFSSGD